MLLKLCELLSFELLKFEVTGLELGLGDRLPESMGVLESTDLLLRIAIMRFW